MGNKAALMVIDVQAGMFLESNPVHKADILIKNIRNLLKKARLAGTPIIYVQHNARIGKPLEPGTPGWEIHPDISPMRDDIIIQKHTPDAFYESNLQAELTDRGISKLIVTGIQTEICIDTTCRRARSLGYDVILAKDVHSTWNSGKLSAEQIIDHHNNLLGWFAAVEESSSITFG